MSELSQSQFLQALGWATLNSFWQMALLWCAYVSANHLFNLTAAKKYILSVVAVLSGFVWFLVSFSIFYRQESLYNLSFLNLINSSETYLSLFLTAASVAYLALLVIPAYRLFANWRYVNALRSQGLQKADIHYKIFIKRVAGHLGIKRTVGIYFSELVKSPVTIGYLKPIILLPVAAANQLTIQQAEAVLLHELSHIRRYDYLLNILMSVANTFLYFNPFVRMFIKIAEEERENCCDQIVLQFGYDKLSYASALLSLEKTALQTHVFAIGATGKQNLLTRIEKIVGMEKKPVLKFTHFASVVAALLCIFSINSIVINIKEKDAASLVTFDHLANPFYFLSEEQQEQGNESPVVKNNSIAYNKKTLVDIAAEPSVPPMPPMPENETVIELTDKPLEFLRVSVDEIDAGLSSTEKEKVRTTVENTKKVLGKVQWKEVEKAIADVLTNEEKLKAREDYLREIENIDWTTLEKNLKADYEKINWPKIDLELKNALATARLDSLQQSYEHMLREIEKSVPREKCSVKEALPFPDESIEVIEIHKQKIRSQVREIKAIKEKKVIKL